jgi:hypothetical protein
MIVPGGLAISADSSLTSLEVILSIPDDLYG